MASAAISITEYDTGSYGVEVAPGIPDSITTASEVVAWVTRQHARRPTPEYVPEWQQVWDAAGEVLIRRTLPHRDDDHYVENVGEGWHRALTHDMDVYTGDDYVDRVRID